MAGRFTCSQTPPRRAVTMDQIVQYVQRSWQAARTVAEAAPNLYDRSTLGDMRESATDNSRMVPGCNVLITNAWAYACDNMSLRPRTEGHAARFERLSPADQIVIVARLDEGCPRQQLVMQLDGDGRALQRLCHPLQVVVTRGDAAPPGPNPSASGRRATSGVDFADKKSTRASAGAVDRHTRDARARHPSERGRHPACAIRRRPQRRAASGLPPRAHLRLPRPEANTEVGWNREAGPLDVREQSGSIPCCSAAVASSSNDRTADSAEGKRRGNRRRSRQSRTQRQEPGTRHQKASPSSLRATAATYSR